MPFRDAAEGELGCGCAARREATSAAWHDAAATAAAAAAPPSGFAQSNPDPSYAPDLTITPTHLDISLHFDLARKRAVGRVVTTVVAPVATRNRTLALNAVAFRDVSVEAVDGGAVTGRYDGQAVQLTWAAPFAPGEQRRVAVNYVVEEPITGLFFSVPDEAYPQRAEYAITDNETERARYWMPCVDFPTVRTTLEFHLRTDAGFLAVANGRFVGQAEHPDGTTTTTWRLDYPCPSYLACLAVGRLQRVPFGEVDGLPITLWGPAATPADRLTRSFQETPAMLRWLAQRVGTPFPFPKYDQIAAPAIRGAMENISLVTWNHAYLLDEKMARERQHLFNLINIHEMAHSYFGDALVIRHFEHAWLKESWATYMEAVWTEEHVGPLDFQWELWDHLTSYVHETERYVRPIVTRVYDSSWSMFDSHLYPGGSWRIHMLRRLLGDTAFWEGVQSYVRTHQRQVVETDDFRRHLERVSARNLTRFFDQWFYGKGFPKLKGEFKHNAERNEVAVTLEQTQPADHTLFTVDIEVLVTYTLPDAPERHTVLLTVPLGTRGTARKETAVALLPAGAKPIMVQVDPKNKVLFTLEFNPGEDLLRETLKSATNDLFSRLRAVQELAKVGTPAAVQAIVDAMATEPFYGVRQRAAEVLKETGTAAALRGLATLLDRETDPRALQFIDPGRANAVGACSTRDEVVRQALLRFLARDDLPYRAEAAAWHMLGKQRHPEDVARLTEVVRDRRRAGLNGHVHAGAWRGLGEHTAPAVSMALVSLVFALLKAQVAYGVEPEELVRPVVVSALANYASRLAPHLQKEAADLLADLTRDPSPDVRSAAAAGLVQIRAREHAGHLEKLKAVTAAQDHFRLDRQLRRLRDSGDAPAVEKLKSELEELQRQVRKMAEQLAKLEADGKAVRATAGGAATPAAPAVDAPATAPTPTTTA